MPPIHSKKGWAVTAAILLCNFTAFADTVEIKISMEAPMRFVPPRFAVEPGDQVQINVQNLDITDMPHNIVFTTPGNTQNLVMEALELAEKGPELNYIPQSDSVLAALKILKPGNKDELKFTVPTEPGVYPYVCTFPGHGLMMYGAMYVGKKMPPLEEDSNIPKMALIQMQTEVIRPSFQRMFMPDSGPAAIAVALTGTQNFCWDAGACRLRYLWQGEFIDASMNYAGNGNALANVLGDIYWQNPEGAPFSFNVNADPENVKFLGYRIVDGVPEFRYKVDGTLVREHITETDDGKGIKRHFQIDNAPAPVHFPLDLLRPNDFIGVQLPGGKIKNGVLTLSPKAAADFTITIFRRK